MGEADIAVQRVTDIALELDRLLPLAFIFGTQDCVAALSSFFSHKSEPDLKTPKDWAKKAGDRSMALATDLTKPAKHDLGLES